MTDLMQHFLSLFDHQALSWLIKSTDIFLVYTYGSWWRAGETTGLGGRRLVFQSWLFHKLALHCFRELLSFPRPWIPIHKIDGWDYWAF